MARASVEEVGISPRGVGQGQGQVALVQEGADILGRGARGHDQNQEQGGD